jgi:hypothetical protein
MNTPQGEPGLHEEDQEGRDQDPGGVDAAQGIRHRIRIVRQGRARDGQEGHRVGSAQPITRRKIRIT